MTDIDKFVAELVPRYRDKDGKPKSPQELRLEYDSTSETLEPIYFWLVDWLQKNFGKCEKLVDNFASSPGSGHFGEMQQRASQMQQEASRVLGTVNNILKGIINLIYDLKEFKVRLSHYESANSKDKSISESGLLSLKQVWMDKVDMQRGQGSINAMASGNLQFITLRDAFMVVNSPAEVDKLDLNERVKRVLKPRVQEFFEWKIRSEQELRKRFEIEKIYLKSQVSALKLNSRWARPYLRAAEQLKGNDALSGSVGMINAFNTILLELCIMTKSTLNVSDASSARNPNLPRDFKYIKKLRNYNSVIFIDFNFRGIPNKSGQHFTFGGRAEVYFRAYALNDDEILLLKNKLEQSDINYALGLVEGMTKDSLEQIQVDIDEFLGDEKEKDKKVGELNFFSGIFDFFKSSSKAKKESDEDKIKRLKEIIKQRGKLKTDSFPEEYIRNVAEATAMNMCFTVYDKYKSAHGMPKFPYGGNDEEASPPSTAAGTFFGTE